MLHAYLAQMDDLTYDVLITALHNQLMRKLKGDKKREAEEKLDESQTPCIYADTMRNDPHHIRYQHRRLFVLKSFLLDLQLNKELGTVLTSGKGTIDNYLYGYI